MKTAFLAALLAGCAAKNEPAVAAPPVAGASGSFAGSTPEFARPKHVEGDIDSCLQIFVDRVWTDFPADGFQLTIDVR